MKLYKLTDQNGKTKNDTKWVVGKTVEIKPCKNPELCTNTVLHAYRNLNLALLLNPIHADIANPSIFEVEGDIVVEDWGKCGSFSLTTRRKFILPEWYTGRHKNDVLIQFAILCAESAVKIVNCQGAQLAIDAAKDYLETKSKSAANAAANAAAYAADAADAAYAAYAADAAAYAADAANAAANAAHDIDFCELADKAVEMIMHKEGGKG